MRPAVSGGAPRLPRRARPTAGTGDRIVPPEERPVDRSLATSTAPAAKTAGGLVCRTPPAHDHQADQQRHWPLDHAKGGQHCRRQHVVVAGRKTAPGATGWRRGVGASQRRHDLGEELAERLGSHHGAPSQRHNGADERCRSEGPPASHHDVQRNQHQRGVLEQRAEDDRETASEPSAWSAPAPAGSCRRTERRSPRRFPRAPRDTPGTSTRRAARPLPRRANRPRHPHVAQTGLKRNHEHAPARQRVAPRPSRPADIPAATAARKSAAPPAASG